MPALSTCHACDGFLPPAATICPHCDTTAATSTRRSRFARFSRALFGMAGSGAVAVTLMACYGAGAMRGRYARPQPPGQCQPHTDMDHDGVCQPEDCNDNRRDIHPGAPDNTIDGVDQNCDGTDGPAPPPARATPPPPKTPPATATPPAGDAPAKATSP